MKACQKKKKTKYDELIAHTYRTQKIVWDRRREKMLTSKSQKSIDIREMKRAHIVLLAFQIWKNDESTSVLNWFFYALLSAAISQKWTWCYLMKNKAIKILSLNFILFFSNKTKKAIKGGAGIKVDDWWLH